MSLLGLKLDDIQVSGRLEGTPPSVIVVDDVGVLFIQKIVDDPGMFGSRVRLGGNSTRLLHTIMQGGVDLLSVTIVDEHVLLGLAHEVAIDNII